MNNKEINPLVSICCITYNHEKYISDAIESFIMQKTSFPVEIIIHDDASSDNTTNIIREYEKKYPELFTCIFQKENQYSKGIRGIAAQFTFLLARGKYIALCEGDDYWTDPYKLQKQVDFLEANSDYGVVHGNCNIYIEKNNKWIYNANKNLKNNVKINSKTELFNLIVNGDYKIRTCTVLFRRELIDRINLEGLNFLMGDTPLWINFSLITGFKYFDEIWGVYRVIQGSVSNPIKKIERARFALSMAEMRVFYSIKYDIHITKKLAKRYNKALIEYKIYSPEYKELYSLIKPTRFQYFKFKNINKKIFRSFLYLEMMISHYSKTLVDLFFKKFYLFLFSSSR